MGYDLDESDGEAKIIAFSERWQGLEAEGLLRAMSMATGDDRFFAIRLLIASGLSSAAEEAVFVLRAQIASPDGIAHCIWEGWETGDAFRYCKRYLLRHSLLRQYPLLPDWLNIGMKTPNTARLTFWAN